MVNAGHWYDAATLLTKEYSTWFGIDVLKAKPVFGKKAIRETFATHMNTVKEETLETMGNQPTLIGEFGIPFDLNKRRLTVITIFKIKKIASIGLFRP